MPGYRSVLLPLSGALVLALGAPPAAGATGGGIAEVGVPRPVTPPGGAAEGSPVLSGDGRYVAFSASSTDPRGHLHRRLVRADLVTGSAVVVNRRADGGVAGGNYSTATMSSDGSLVAFTANGRLTADDSDDRFDAFVRHVPSGSTRLVSGADGQAGTAAVSGNGRWVVFTSTGTDLVAGSTLRNSDVYRRDLASGAVLQITVRPDGSPSRGPGANDADVSADGSLVAFLSYATDVAPADGDDGEPDLFLRDVRAGTTRWLGAQTPAGAQPSSPVLSPDGRWLVSRYADASLHLTRTSDGVTRLLAADATIGKGAFSADGRLVAYGSAGRAYVQDLRGGFVHELRQPPGGFAAGGAALSGDGRRAAYDWVSDDGTPGQVYVVDLVRR